MVIVMGCFDRPLTQEEPSWLEVTETAISEVGYWRWWTQNTSGAFQVEFGGVLLYNKPAKNNVPPSSLLALRFEDTRCIATLRRYTGLEGIPDDWFDLLAKDEMQSPTVICEEFTLTNTENLKRIFEQSEETHYIVGQETDLMSIKPVDAFLGFWAGDIGLVIVAKEMSPVTADGDLTPQQILEKYEQWWVYWREYWKRKSSGNPMPKDYACEVTIPLKE